jgi:hypothetical protein
MNTPTGMGVDLFDLHIKTEYNPNDLGKNAPGNSSRPLSALEFVIGSVVLFPMDSVRLQRHPMQARGRALWR